MAKRTPSNTVTNTIKAMVSASLPDIEPPSHVRLRESDKAFWSCIIGARTRDEWTKNDLVVAAQLARCQSDIESEAELLDSEGSVVENNRGTQIMNPRHSVLEQLSRREMALMRCLGIAGFAARPPKEDLVKSRQVERDAKKALAEIGDEDLLAL